MNAVKFTVELRERFLTLFERGDSIEDCCADVGISRVTVAKWAAKGRKQGAGPGEEEFASRFDEIRGGRREASLSAEDVVRLLERSARRGSVQAMRLLLERMEKPEDADREPAEPEDPFVALEGDELAPRRARRTGT